MRKRLRALRLKIMRRFGRDSISLGRVHGRLDIKEGNDRLTLYVDADPMRLSAGLVQAKTMMDKWGEKATAKQQRECALYFAGVMFGEEQAKTLLDFYRGNAACVVNVCGQYFSNTLRFLIEKAQRNAYEAS